MPWLDLQEGILVEFAERATRDVEYDDMVFGFHLDQDAPTDEYVATRREADRLRNKRPDRRQQTREWKAANREHVRAHARAYWHANKAKRATGIGAAAP